MGVKDPDRRRAVPFPGGQAELEEEDHLLEGAAVEKYGYLRSVHGDE
jgi:hypothetical protein